MTVFHQGAVAPTERISASRAPEVFEAIKTLLARHPDCHRIRVESVAGLLFAVDCNGETVADG